MPGWGISPKLIIGVWTLMNKQFSSPFTSSKSIPGIQSGISAKEFKQPLPKSVAGLIPAHGLIGWGGRNLNLFNWKYKKQDTR